MSIWREISNGAIGWELLKQAIIGLLNNFILIVLECEGPDFLVSCCLLNFSLLFNFFLKRVLFTLGLILHLCIIPLVWCRGSLSLLERRKLQWLVCFYARDAVIVLLVNDLTEFGIGISFYLTLNMVPFFAALAFDPLFSIVSLVLLTFIEIDLLAVVAELLALECEWAQIAEPRVLVPVKLSTGPEVLRLVPGLNVCLRAYRVFAHPQLFGRPSYPSRQRHSSWSGIHIYLFVSLVQYWLLAWDAKVRCTVRDLLGGVVFSEVLVTDPFLSALGLVCRHLTSAHMLWNSFSSIRRRLMHLL